MSIVKNPDPEFCRNFKKRLKSNSGYCPCALEKTPDTRDMVEHGEEGWCDCGMYYNQPDEQQQ